MGRLCFGPFWYGPFLHLGRFVWAVFACGPFGMGRFRWDDLVSGPTSPESSLAPY